MTRAEALRQMADLLTVIHSPRTLSDEACKWMKAMIPIAERDLLNSTPTVPTEQHEVATEERK